jgi:tetratricopeptide (TPR) repeat protein
MNTIPQYCQKCREKNELGEPTCRRCGTRLMLVVFPQSLKYDTNYVPTYYEDHLLERVTALELRLAQVAERLATTLDLMLRQTKTAHSDHILLETLIESLNTLGAVEKDKLTKNWRERLDAEELKDKAKRHREQLIAKILAGHADSQADLFAHLVNEGIKLLSENEEKQGLRTLERALLLSPGNVALLMFISESLFSSAKFELAKLYLEKAHILVPDDAKILLLLGVIYADEGETSHAKELMETIGNDKNSAFCASYARGMIAAFDNEWTKALASFKESLTAINLPETHYLVGCAYYQIGRYKMALRHLQKAVEEDSNFADAWYMLSVIYDISNEREKSREAAELAWMSKEAGAQCLEFLKQKRNGALPAALPFLRLRHLKNRFLTGGSSRLARLFNEELFKTLNK